MIGDSGKTEVPGSEKPCEGLATSLHFSSQPGSSSTSTHGNEEVSVVGERDSPVKISPVSERIKALEALAAKTKESDFRGNGGFTPLKDRFLEKSSSTVAKSPFEMPKSFSETTKSPPEVKTFPEAAKPLSEMSKLFSETRLSSEVTKSSESTKSPSQSSSEKTKMGDSVDQESPESPFEILGDMRQVNEFEETQQWLKANLPPVLDFDSGDLTKGVITVPSEVTDTAVHAAFAAVPDAFMDLPVEVGKTADMAATQKPGIEQEFDISFLPTAYMLEDEKSSVEAASNQNSVIQSPPAPPSGYGTISPPLSPLACSVANQKMSHEKVSSGDLKKQEASEGDSSGESDDTVIEDEVRVLGSVPSQSFDSPILNNTTTVPRSTAPDSCATKEETPPPKSERKLMQVPTINVIETDEPNYSEDEMEMEPEAEEDEDYDVKDQTKEASESSKPENNTTELPKTRPLETEFMEGYSPPSSPVDSDAEYSPKHKLLKSIPETEQQTKDLVDSAVNSFQAQPQTDQTQTDQPQTGQLQTASDFVKVEPPQVAVRDKEVEFPDDDEWSDEVQTILVSPSKTDLSFKDPSSYHHSKEDERRTEAPKEAFTVTAPLPLSSFMQDDIYDRQSFDYEFELTSSLEYSEDKQLSNAKERFLSDPVQNEVTEDLLDLDTTISLIGKDRQPSLDEDVQNPYSCFESETMNRIESQFLEKVPTENVAVDVTSVNIQQDPKVGYSGPDTTRSSHRVNNSLVSEPTDSFVDFMRECLKSRQDKESDDVCQGVPSKNELSMSLNSPSHISPSMVLDHEQEHLTISALKGLGSSQEEDVVNLQSKALDQNQTNPSFTPEASALNPPCSQSRHVCDNTHSKEVEAIDEWVAEAYHLAEHVLTAILTHFSGNTSSLWAVCLLTSCTLLKILFFVIYYFLHYLKS